MTAPRAELRLAELVKDPARVGEVDPGEVPALILRLCALQSALATRLSPARTAFR